MEEDSRPSARRVDRDDFGQLYDHLVVSELVHDWKFRGSRMHPSVFPHALTGDSVETVVLLHNEEMVGLAQLTNHSPLDGTVELSIVAFRDHQGSTAFTLALDPALRLLTSMVNARKIYANLTSLSLEQLGDPRRYGFRHVATLGDHLLLSGSLTDLHVYETEPTELVAALDRRVSRRTGFRPLSEPSSKRVLSAIAEFSGVPVEGLENEGASVALDSLALVELLDLLETTLGRTITAETLGTVETARDAALLARQLIPGD